MPSAGEFLFDNPGARLANIRLYHVEVRASALVQCALGRLELISGTFSLTLSPSRRLVQVRYACRYTVLEYHATTHC